MGLAVGHQVFDAGLLFVADSFAFFERLACNRGVGQSGMRFDCDLDDFIVNKEFFASVEFVRFRLAVDLFGM
jgi:hypothetical protein